MDKESQIEVNFSVYAVEYYNILEITEDYFEANPIEAIDSGRDNGKLQQFRGQAFNYSGDFMSVDRVKPVLYPDDFIFKFEPFYEIFDLRYANLWDGMPVEILEPSYGRFDTFFESVCENFNFRLIFGEGGVEAEIRVDNDREDGEQAKKDLKNEFGGPGGEGDRKQVWKKVIIEELKLKISDAICFKNGVALAKTSEGYPKNNTGFLISVKMTADSNEFKIRTRAIEDLSQLHLEDFSHLKATGMPKIILNANSDLVLVSRPKTQISLPKGNMKSKLKNITSHLTNKNHNESPDYSEQPKTPMMSFKLLFDSAVPRMRSRSPLPSKSIKVPYRVYPGSRISRKNDIFVETKYLKSQYNFNRLGLSFQNKNNENRIRTEKLRKWDSSIVIGEVFEVGAGNGVLVDGLRLDGLGKDPLGEEDWAIRLKIDSSCLVNLEKGLVENERELKSRDRVETKRGSLVLEGVEREEVGLNPEEEQGIAFLLLVLSSQPSNEVFGVVVVSEALDRIKEVKFGSCEPSSSSRDNGLTKKGKKLDLLNF